MKGLLLTEIGLTILAVVSMAGCTTRPTTLGPDYGLAYIMANDAQTLNPEAGTNLDPVQGLEDGATAKHTMERYRSSFEKPEDIRKPMANPSMISSGIQTR
ncbi:MAG TPA: hypothetical protein VLM19_05680 [Nitrospiraceae bacterium]|nr:hypothetical protein [Nitrospiraceae bacterium]